MRIDILFAMDGTFAVLSAQCHCTGVKRYTCTLVNVYVALPVFTPVAGRSYAHFMEQNGGAHDVNS